MSSRVGHTLRWLICMAWMILIFLLSHESAGGSQARSGTLVETLLLLGINSEFADPLTVIIRKTAHVTLYAVLGGLLIWTLASRYGMSRRIAVLSMIIAGTYALTDEIHQVFIPGRSGELGDILLDIVGAGAGAGLSGLMLMRARQKYFTDTTKSAKVSE